MHKSTLKIIKHKIAGTWQVPLRTNTEKGRFNYERIKSRRHDYYTACSQGSNGAGASPNQSASSGLQSGAITSQTASSSETPLNSSGGEKRILVAYFSWSGNTQEMASYIAQQTGGDLLELQPEIPYPTDYNQCGEVALNERDTNARPAISNLPSSISEYDAVLLVAHGAHDYRHLSGKLRFNWYGDISFYPIRLYGYPAI